jgi:GDP-D-mannose 3',5'-epimerase
MVYIQGEKKKHQQDGGTIKIIGDGKQTRSFLYIDDCIEGVRKLMTSDFTGPVNIGSEEMIPINDFAKMIIQISGKNINMRNINGPTGVRGRNSDNNLLRLKLNWEPIIKLYNGIELLYNWIDADISTNINESYEH